MTLFAGKQREAPAMFKEGGRYFLITSAATGWDPNQAKYASATTIAGPWTALTNLGDGTTFDTQSAYVIPLVGTRRRRTSTPAIAGRILICSSKYIWLPLEI